jgi:hypothetical protein
MAKTDQVVLSGGCNEKTNSPGSVNYMPSSNLLNKIIIGDKFGNIHLMDVSRK